MVSQKHPGVPLVEFSNSEFVTLYQRHDLTALFNALWEKISRLLAKRLLDVTHDGEVLDDLLQETYLRIWRGWHATPPPAYVNDGQLVAWCQRIAMNIGIDYNRERGRHVAVVTVTSQLGGGEPIDETQPDPQELVTSRYADDLVLMREVWSELTPDEQHRLVQGEYLRGAPGIHSKQLYLDRRNAHDRYRRRKAGARCAARRVGEKEGEIDIKSRAFNSVRERGGDAA